MQTHPSTSADAVPLKAPGWVFLELIERGLASAARRRRYSPGRNLVNTYDNADIAILDVSLSSNSGIMVPSLCVASDDIANDPRVE